MVAEERNVPKVHFEIRLMEVPRTMDFLGLGSIVRVPYQGKTVNAEVLGCQKIRRYEPDVDEVMLNLGLVR
jgi:hypothetical protein